MTTKLIFPLTFWLLCVLHGAAFATDYTVGSGKDYATIQGCINAAQAGDNCIIDAGTYTSENALSSASSGSDGNLITIQPAAGATVNVSRFTITHDYIKVDGLHIVAPTGSEGTAGFNISGNYDQITNNTLYGNGSTAYGMNVTGDYLTVTGNTWDGNNNDCGNIFFIAMRLSSASQNATVSGNTFKNICSNERIWQIHGINHVFTNNEAYNFAWTDGGNHPDIFQTLANSGISDNILIEWNYFRDIDGQIGNMESALTAPLVSNWTVRNNVFANVIGTWYVKAGNFSVYNNTFFRCGYTNQHVIQFGDDGNGDGSGGVVRNNVIIGSATSAGVGTVGIIGAGDPARSYNYYSTPTYGARSGISETGGISGGDPTFVSPSDNCVATACDFSLQAGSVLIDNGVDLSAYFTTDYAGTSRPQGIAWDIGAYEYASGDLTPSAFSFGADVTGAEISTLTPSPDNVTVAGIDNTTSITISGTGCEYSVDGGAFTANAGTVGLDNVVALHTTSSGTHNATITCTVTIGGVSDSWGVTTLAAAEDATLPRRRAGGRGGWR